MPKLRIRIKKEMYASYELTTDTDRFAVVEKLEEEKLRSSEYEESLKLEWDFGEYSPEVIEIDDLSDEDEAA
jgi:hypothetical protein